MLKEKLLRFCSKYNGEKQNPYNKNLARLYWDWEYRMVRCVEEICRNHNIYINFDFFIKKNSKIDYIVMYLLASIPSIKRSIRIMMPEMHVKYGENVFDKLAASDEEWEAFREQYADVPKGGITINHK